MTRRRPRPAADPFAVLGLAARPDLTDDDVRAAWRRVAAATHPDRPDGGEPGQVRRGGGRLHAAADQVRPRRGDGRREASPPPGWLRRAAARPGRPTARACEHQRPGGHQRRPGHGQHRLGQAAGQHRPRPGCPAAAQATLLAGGWRATGGSVKAGISWRLPAAVRLAARVRRGRPGRLALRVLAAAGASAAAWAAAGSGPAGPALVTGAVTWLLLTARQDLAPPPG